MSISCLYFAVCPAMHMVCMYAWTFMEMICTLHDLACRFLNRILGMKIELQNQVRQLCSSFFIFMCCKGTSAQWNNIMCICSIKYSKWMLGRILANMVWYEEAMLFAHLHIYIHTYKHEPCITKRYCIRSMLSSWLPVHAVETTAHHCYWYMFRSLEVFQSCKPVLMVNMSVQDHTRTHMYMLAEIQNKTQAWPWLRGLCIHIYTHIHLKQFQERDDRSMNQ